MKRTIQPIKGTTDFYPEEMARRVWLYNHIRQVSESFGYQEYEGPILESVELYAAKSGEELVNEQSFVFPDRGGDLITLRPELTPTLARMVAQQQNQLNFPIRWWSFGPMWRYERPQKGRTREFFQWNIDLVGMDSPEADAELVAIGASLLESVGLTSDLVTIRVNSRRLMEAELKLIGIPDDLTPKVIQLIDKKDRMPPEKWGEVCLEVGVEGQQVAALNTLLMNKAIWRKSAELVDFFAAVDAFGCADYVEFSPSTIRGLNYYTGIIFECFDRKGENRSIFAGGRYDNLVADVGGSPLPGVGFAMGDKVIQVVLEANNLLPDGQLIPPPAVFFAIFSKEYLPHALKFATQLRKLGLKVVTYPGEAKLNRQMKYASRLGTRITIILGPDEIATDRITIKDMDDQTQKTLPSGELLQEISRILAREFPV